MGFVKFVIGEKFVNDSFLLTFASGFWYETRIGKDGQGIKEGCKTETGSKCKIEKEIC